MKFRLCSLVALLLALVMCFTGCSLFGAKAKKFEKAGLAITLNENFSESAYEFCTAAYESPQMQILTRKEEFSLFESTDYNPDMSLTEYAQLVISANEITAEAIEEKGLTYFEFEPPEKQDDNYYHVGYVFKGSNAFWLVQFAVKKDSYKKLQKDITKYAKSVVVE